MSHIFRLDFCWDLFRGTEWQLEIFGVCFFSSHLQKLFWTTLKLFFFWGDLWREKQKIQSQKFPLLKLSKRWFSSHQHMVSPERTINQLKPGSHSASLPGGQSWLFRLITRSSWEDQWRNGNRLCYVRRSTLNCFVLKSTCNLFKGTSFLLFIGDCVCLQSVWEQWGKWS